MRHPRVIVCGPDDWIATQLADRAGERGWLVRAVRRPAAALELVRAGRPTVLVVQADPTAADPGPLGLVATVCRLAPDVPTVAVSDVKLGDADRAAWAAAVADLGARVVLFPPLTRPVLEDAVGGLMAVAVRRAGGAP